MRHVFNNPRQLVIINIVLRLDPVAGPVGSILFFFKSKQRRFSKKNNKSQQVCNRVAGSTRRVSRVTPGFFFPRFFFNPVGFQPRVCRVPDRPVGSGRVSILWLLGYNLITQCNVEIVVILSHLLFCGFIVMILYYKWWLLLIIQGFENDLT